MYCSRLGIFASVGLWFAAVSLAPTFESQLFAQESAPPDAEGLEFFEKKIRPLLAEKCYSCHGSEKQKSGLRLDSLSAAIGGGDSGPALIPGQPDESNLVRAIRYTGDFYDMPPDGKLTDAEIELLTQWVKRGVPGPRGDSPVAADNKSIDVAQRRAEHWVWQPPKKTQPPAVQEAGWPRTPLDHFVLSKLEAAQLRPAPEAQRRVWLRRVTFDIIGLPPTPEETAAFLADTSELAHQRVVERLLDSPHYGERWARHWLDLVRYAETRGHEFDYPIANAFQYRDYVIRALNADVPYDQFVVEHLAGDLLQPARVNPESGANESVLGTGFWFLGEEVHSPVDIRQDQMERVDNKVDVFSKTFLGITLACARCHDHKFDAITTADYYALSGFIQSASYRQIRFETLEAERKIAQERQADQSQSAAELLPQWSAAIRPALSMTAKYLRAAHEAQQSLPADAQGEALIALENKAIETAAFVENLNEARLKAWLDDLRKAAADPRHPLHAFGLITIDRAGKPAARIAQKSVEILDHQRHTREASERALDGATIIADYRLPDASPFLPDGFAYGSAPRRAGELILSADPQRPLAGVIQRGAAVFDGAFNVLVPRGGTEGDSGRVNWSQPGRTLRTPSVLLESGNVYHLVRGAGYAYASVEHHRMLQGPLHGELVREWGPGNGWRWEHQDLTKYRGHRVHVEFTPKDGNNDFAIALVVEKDQAPGDPFPGNARLTTELLAEPHRASLDALCEAYEKLFLDVVDRAAAGELSPSDAARDNDEARKNGDAVRDNAEIAHWIMQQGDLFPLDPEHEAWHRVAREFSKRQQELLAAMPRESWTAPALLEGSGVDEFLLLRGNHRTPADPVSRRFLSAIDGEPLAITPRGSGRLELARRIVVPENPLVSRVIVNRLWHHLFGRGIVSTVDNLGVLGERPTHPELLDWLAVDFVEQGWSIKRALKQIVLSGTYRMSSPIDAAAETADPQNLLLHRAPIRRLQAETIRDSLLAVSGRLDRRLYGPSVLPFLTPFMDGRGRPASGPLDGEGRRSIYLGVRRNFLSPFFLSFDYPIPFSSVGRRTVSNVPAQALSLLNDPLVVEQSKLLAQRVSQDPQRSTEQRIDWLFELLYTREPQPSERAASIAFLSEQGSRHGANADDPRAWQDLCHVLINVKQFIYLQ